MWFRKVEYWCEDTFRVIITLFILMDFLIHIDTINMDLSILKMCLKGSQVELSVFYLYSFWVIVNVLLSVDLF